MNFAMNFTMNHDNLQKWSPRAWELAQPLEKLPVPFHVLAGEALDVARFAQRYWEPATDHSGAVVRPGLRSAATGAFTNELAEELLELHDALQAAQTDYQLSVDMPEAAPVERAQFLLGELHAVLAFLFDDGEEDLADAQLQQLASVHDNALSHDALAAALFDYAGLAELHRAAIDGLGGFDAGNIDEARRIASSLRERSAGPAVLAPIQEQRQRLELRNRIATLLYERMQRIRATARFVFRHHPDLVRQVTSAYGRQQRAAYRKRRREAVDAADASAESPAAPAEE